MRAGALARLLLAGFLAVVGAALVGVWLQGRPHQGGFSVAVAGSTTRSSPGPPAAVSDAQVGFRSAALAVPTDVAVPQRISVTDLEIDAPVVPVGVDDQGRVAVPADGSVVGWYRWSSSPGTAGNRVENSVGNTVLAGHVDTRAAGPGALFDLVDVRAGEVVRVELSDGTTRAYEVVARQDYGKSDLPVEELFGREGPAQLVLITCGGAFDAQTRQYAENVVVTAVPVG